MLGNRVFFTGLSRSFHGALGSESGGLFLLEIRVKVLLVKVSCHLRNSKL